MRGQPGPRDRRNPRPGLAEDGQPGRRTVEDPKVINIQEQGGIKKTVEATVRAVREVLPEANACVQDRTAGLEALILAMECGGSDGNSGVTANPALGVAADLVVAQGGTAVLGETSEIYGAEHLLTRRAVSREVGEKLVERIKLVGMVRRRSSAPSWTTTPRRATRRAA